MTVKQVIRKTHLWLGIITGPIVFVIAITGCIYAFQSEIQDGTQSYRFSKVENKLKLPPSNIIPIAKSAMPGKHLHALMYGENGRSTQAIFYGYNSYYDIVYLNPYTGKILKVHDVDNSFFGFILKGHFYLWLPPEIGQPIVASATLIFFFLLVSGIYLWWPRNKNNKRQKFTIKWSARWRRRNYDLHSVVGFYVSWLSMILVVTGLIWGFVWFRNGVFWLTSGGEDFKEYTEPSSQIQTSKEKSDPLDSVWKRMNEQYPNNEWIEIHPPESDLSPIAANANSDESTYWKMDYRYFDQYSLKELKVKHQWGRISEASGADKLMRMNYDIHVGGILGISGKLLAFILSLTIASLPITGLLIWYGRRNSHGKCRH